MRNRTIHIKWTFPVLLDNFDKAKYKDYNGIYAI